jgi:hypothetical protein
MRHKLDLEKIDTQVKAEAKVARENRDINLEMMRTQIVERIRSSFPLSFPEF